ncbi:MAG: sarcosine oxidase subunit gamma family protein [Halofilum sp. (in: g-proteobacteria)]|nr:sarcosine oxidase subunit gamma family protein [Halofilum sp. (in: g-proteobacteria)]
MTLCELTGWDLVQAAAWRGRYEPLCERVQQSLGVAPPDAPGRCVREGELEIITAAPSRLWCIGPVGSERLAGLAEAVDEETGCLTELGHSHARVRLRGPSVRDLLMQEIAIDLDPSVTDAGRVMRTGFHHVPVTLQCIDADAHHPTFDLYLPTTFASSTWEYLLDLATAYGYEILERAACFTEGGTTNEHE